VPSLSFPDPLYTIGANATPATQHAFFNDPVDVSLHGAVCDAQFVRYFVV